MTPEQVGQLQQQLYAAQVENEQLRNQVAQLAQTQQSKKDRRDKVVRGGGRLLIPLLDRQKVVRSFGKLAETAGSFTGPREDWAPRDDVLGDSRRFLEALVRFAVRRRMLLIILSLFAAIIPAIQIYLVVQQNQIIENQNEFLEIQVYDVVSRSMTEGDRNARLMTGALLSRANPAFLAGVVEEAFDPNVSGVYSAAGVEASRRRLQDAVFRGYLVQAVVRSAQRRMQDPNSPMGVVAAQMLPMLRIIVQDATGRVPEVIRLGAGDAKIDGELAEQVDGYLVKVGEAMGVYGRLARSQGETAAYFEDIGPYLTRVSQSKLSTNRFSKAQAFSLEVLLFELAVEPDPRDATHVDLKEAGLSPEEARAKGIEVLRQAVGADAADWDALAKYVEGA
ncbi:MAG: hypothetical protein K0V04_43645 [Deltaproteobacteria bacterium]|nr:hypothetical protein [Deltaproteobacteria bacterium]